MKKMLIAAGLATAVATTGFANTASAHNNIGGAIGAGIVFGLIGGAIANSYYYGPPPYYGYGYYPYYGYYYPRPHYGFYYYHRRHHHHRHHHPMWY